MLKMTKSKAIFLLIITALLWSLGGVFIKSINWNPYAIAGMRSTVSAIFLICLRKNIFFKLSGNKLCGGVAYAGTVVLFVIATKMTTAANAIILQYTAPIYVALFSAWFLKEKIYLVDWITIVAVLGSLCLFFFDKLEPAYTKGNLVAIASGICFGWLALFLRKEKDGSPIDSVIIGNIIAALICMPFYFKSMPDMKSWIFIILLGIVQISIPYILYTIAIRHVKAVEAITIPMLEPVLNPIWVFIFIREMPGPWAMAGGLLVLSAIIVRSLILIRK